MNECSFHHAGHHPVIGNKSTARSPINKDLAYFDAVYTIAPQAFPASVRIRPGRPVSASPRTRKASKCIYMPAGGDSRHHMQRVPCGFDTIGLALVVTGLCMGVGSCGWVVTIAAAAAMEIADLGQQPPVSRPDAILFFTTVSSALKTSLKAIKVSPIATTIARTTGTYRRGKWNRGQMLLHANPHRRAPGCAKEKAHG